MNLSNWTAALVACVLLATTALASYAQNDFPDSALPQGCDDIGQPKVWPPDTVVFVTGLTANNTSDALAEAGGFSCEDCEELEGECPMVASGGQAYAGGAIFGQPDGSGGWNWLFRLNNGGEVVITCVSC